MYRLIMFPFALLVLMAGIFAQEPIWEANTVILEKKKLGEGVFAVVPSITYEPPLEAPKPTSGGFVIGEKAVLVS